MLRLLALVLCAAALLAPALAPATAAADADPASDVLLGQDVFYPYSSAVSTAVRNELNREVAAAKRAGFPVKVALIAGQIDLGAIPALFAKPKLYAKFLDTEISFRTLQPVLVVMAAGVAGDGLPPAATAALASLPPPANDQGGTLAQTAITDVAKLAAAAGHPLGSAAQPASTGRSASSTLPIAIGVAIVIVATLLAVLAVRDRRRRARP